MLVYLTIDFKVKFKSNDHMLLPCGFRLIVQKPARTPVASLA